AAPDGLDAELDGGRARCAGGRQRDRRSLGAELGREEIGDRTHLEAMMIALEPAAAANAHEGVIAEIGSADGLTELFAVRPVAFNRRHGQEEGTWKIALAADPGLRDRLFDRKLRKALGETDR